MKKLLLHTLDNDGTISCDNFYKLSIVAADEKFLPWIVERFIKIQMYENFFICNYDRFDIEHQTYFDEVLEQRECSR